MPPRPPVIPRLLTPDEAGIYCGYKSAEGMKHVPVIIRDLTDQDVIELNLIENIQRRDLTDVEKGRTIRSMLLDEKFQYNTQKDLARAIGVSPVEVNRWVALATRLDPNQPEAYNSMGLLLVAGKRLPEAQAAFREAIRWRPDFADARF